MRSIVVSVLLSTFGLVALFSANSLPTARAQTTQNYSSNWQASQLYRVKLRVNGVDMYGPQIGVSRWTVGGSINNGRITYSETWEGPSAQFINFAGGSGGNRCQSSFDRNKWLAGCFNTGTSGTLSPVVDLEKIDLHVLSDQTCNGPGSSALPDVRASGNSAACKKNVGSSYATGAYGFTFSYSNYATALPDITDEFKHYYTAIPLQWTVNGTINYY